MKRTSAIPLLVIWGLLLGGCATNPSNPKDPLEPYNRAMYQFNDSVDRAVLKPVAQGYKAAVPAPLQMVVSNFFSNLNDVVVAANDLLQFKFKRAASDAARVVINTTAGIYGMADVATMVGLEKHHEDFGQTLGYWGVSSGPYFVLPILGPSSIRDSVGLYADIESNPIQREKHVDVRNEAAATDFIAQRAKLLDSETMLDEAATDRYAFIRDAYLQHRQNEVYDGNPPRPKYEDEDDNGKSQPDAKPQSDRKDVKPDQRSSNDAAPQISPVAQSEPEAALPALSLVSEDTLHLAPPVALETATPPPAVYRFWGAGTQQVLAHGNNSY